MTTTEQTRAAVFDLRTPYLKQGRTTDIRAQTDLMSVTIKVYAEGGENAMHCHPNEDHTFIVLEGEATFHLDSDDNLRVLKPYEGVMLPKGAFYWFESSGDRNLVMVRTGASRMGDLAGSAGNALSERMTPDGRPIPGDSPENKTVERIEAQGKGFGG